MGATTKTESGGVVWSKQKIAKLKSRQPRSFSFATASLPPNRAIPWLLVDLSKLEVVDIFFSFTKPRDDEPQYSFSVRLPKREKNCINQDLQSKEFLEIC